MTSSADKPKHLFKNYVLRNLPGTCVQIAEKTGLGLMTVRRWIKVLHEERACHISSWHRPTVGRFAPVYTAGAGRDKPCKMRAQTRAESTAKIRKLARRELGEEEYKARQALAMRIYRAKKKGVRASWMDLLMFKPQQPPDPKSDGAGR